MTADLANVHDAHAKICLPILLPSFGIYGDVLLNRQEFETFTTKQRNEITEAAQKMRSDFAVYADRIAIDTPEDLPEEFSARLG